MRTKALVQRIDLKTTHEALGRCHHSSASGGAGRYEVYTNKCHMWRQSCVCNNLLFLCRGKHLSVIDHGAHQPQSIIYIDIGATVAKRSGIVQQLITANAVSGCDPVGCHHGIIEMRLLKPCRQELPWTIWEIQKLALIVMKESTHFISACYEQNTYPPDTMHRVRYKVWVSRTGRNGPIILPKLK